jgi:hypothetical protein
MNMIHDTKTKKNNVLKVKFEVLTAASMKMTFFWVVESCSLVEHCRRSKGAYCLQHRSDDGGSKEL